MTTRTSLLRLLSGPAVIFALAAGCAGPGLCERKAKFLTESCAGLLAVSVDPTCKAKIADCTPGQKAQMEGYVSCLESAGECSLDVMRACQDRFPGGVNLLCG